MTVSSHPGNSTASGKKKWLTLDSARNLALIGAAVAVSYAALHSTKQPVPTAPPAQAATAPIEAQVSTAAPSTNSTASAQSSRQVSGKLDVGSDENGEAFTKFINQKIDDLNKVGPVVFAGDAAQAPAPTGTQSTPVQALAASTTQSVLQAAPATSVAEPVKETTSSGLPMTTHKAPFVDQAAKASIESKTAEFMKTGKPGVAKIGYYVDGSLMTAPDKAEQIRSTLSDIPDEWTLIYKAPQEKVRLYAFTDPSCPYCKKLHHALPELLNAGISVHYLMYPRDMAQAAPGELSTMAKNMRNIWCSVDQQGAMNTAFEGYRVPEADCAALPKSLHRPPAPVPDHYNMGQMFDVNGTPTMFASNGKSKAGFSDVQQLISLLLD